MDNAIVEVDMGPLQRAGFGNSKAGIDHDNEEIPSELASFPVNAVLDS